MSRDKAKGIFKVAETKWTEETMHDYTDVVYDDLEVAKDYIIDSGSNSNGYWEKWNSGKLVMKKGFKITRDNDFGSYFWDLPYSVRGFSSIEEANMNSYYSFNISHELLESNAVANSNTSQVTSGYMVNFNQVRLKLQAEPSTIAGRHRYASVVLESRWK